MDVLLDTNIYYDNYFFNSMKFKSLFGYLNKTKSHLLIPTVVKEEIISNYSEKVEEFMETFKKLKSNKRVLFGTDDIQVDQDPREIIHKYCVELNKIFKKHPIVELKLDNVS